MGETEGGGEEMTEVFARRLLGMWMYVQPPSHAEHCG